MIWLTWRQFRVSAAVAFAALAALAVVLGLTGPGLADEYSAGLAACVAGSRDCVEFGQLFFRTKQDVFLVVSLIVLVLPALIGLFWGAPLIARELEGGTHRLVWNQSVTRTRWLTVKLALPGLAAMAVAGVSALLVTLWAGPLDEAAAQDVPRMTPLLFAARGVVPIGYAAFAFALGVATGMVVRRTLPAMAVTLALFTAVQVAMPLLVRPHLLPPVRTLSEITALDVEGIGTPEDRSVLVRVQVSGTDRWILSSRTVDASGHTVELVPLPTSVCAPGGGDDRPPPDAAPPRPRPAPSWLSACVAEMKRLGYRQEVTYQPDSRFWPFQWLETGVYALLTLGVTALCFRWIRRRPS
ncbi:ABC transporter permease [Sphaerisporangium corydalis]|uniref:ABC transporter permease n=1 Tax=Sphaerisporangium corydalis TaxID=1441875 RepID=A0ABV9EGX4_9ACTN|nr:ABC transporter permease [Sphaerisporangium corydalis]